MTDAFVGLGANLGDAHDHLCRATSSLAALPMTRLVDGSAIYRSAPVGPAGQNDYLNAAVQLQTELTPEVLLDELQAIEEAAGRVRTERWGPRTLDLDLLLFGDERIASDRLTVPHPRLGERNFVLLPLADLLGTQHRLAGRSLAQRLEEAPRNRIARTALPLRPTSAEAP